MWYLFGDDLLTIGCCCIEYSGCTQALLDVLVPEEDLRLYAQVEDRIKENEARRHQQLEEAQSHLKGEQTLPSTDGEWCILPRLTPVFLSLLTFAVLSQTLSQLRSTSTRDASNWKSGTEHDDEMERLQTQQFSLIKKINEDEAKLQTIEAELEHLGKEIHNLDSVDIDSQEEMDKDAIAVGLFRKMGFVPCYIKANGEAGGRDNTNEVSSIFESLMVRSESKNRSTEFDVNDDMMKARAVTPYILANQLWLASE